MSALPAVVTGRQVPALEELERARELLIREADRALGLAREALGVVQDCEAELAEGRSPSATLRRSKAAQQIRIVSRMLTRAHCELVHPDDERYSAARRVYGWAVDAERRDAPWRNAA